MQHVVFPKQRSCPPGQNVYRVAFLTPNKYEVEDGKFLDFPRLHGYNFSEHPGGKGHPRWPSGKFNYFDSRMFVQEWGFFRLLQTVHSLLNLPFDRMCWIEDDGIQAHGTDSRKAITTKRLPALALVWAQAKLRLSQEVTNSLLHTLTEYTHEVKRLSTHCYNLGESSLAKTIGLEHTVCAEFLSYFLSVVVVCEYISDTIIGPSFREHWDRLQKEVIYPANLHCLFFRQQLDFAGWCPNEITSAWSYRSASVMLTLSCFDRRGLQREHRPSSTINGTCECELVDRTKLTAVHVPSCNGCNDMISISQWTSTESAVAKLVTDGATPLLKISVVETRPKSITMDVVKADNGLHPTQYVAFSHLWTDGLGPPASGHISACQLLRLMDLARTCTERLQSHQTHTWSKTDAPAFPFWLDSICVPQSNNALADTARQKMTEIYSAAAGVIVLDSTWQNVSFNDESAAIMMASIAFSRWMTRGWTFQEAAFARCCFYLFQDRLVTQNEIEKKNEDQLLSEGTNEWLESITDGQKRQLVNLLDHGNPCSNYSKRALDACTGWKSRMANSSGSMGELWRLLNRRVVSHRSDEALIISGLLHSSLRLDNVDGEDRMRKLFQSFQVVPESMLFHLGERYQTVGTTWIPRSIFRGVGAVQELEWRWLSTEMSKVTPAGLITSANGVVFETPKHFSPGEGGVIIRFGTNRYWLYHVTEPKLFNQMLLSKASRYGLIFPPESIHPFRVGQISGTIVLVSITDEACNKLMAAFDGVWFCHEVASHVDLSSWLIVDAHLKSADHVWCVG